MDEVWFFPRLFVGSSQVEAIRLQLHPRVSLAVAAAAAATEPPVTFAPSEAGNGSSVKECIDC